MPGSKPSMIDGYTSVQAVRRAAQRPKGPARKAEPPPAQSKQAKNRPEAVPPKPAARIGRTAVPDKFDIVCYACGYAFVLSGHLRNTICPKCRENLEMSNTVIAEEYSSTLRTIGTVHVAPTAVLKDAAITARIAVIEADGTNATFACQHIQLAGNGRISLARATFRDLLILEGTNVKFAEQVTCRNLEVKGTLEAPVSVDTVIVRPGGRLRGEVHTRRLVLEDGGSLIARLFLGKDIAADTKDKKSRK